MARATFTSARLRRIAAVSLAAMSIAVSEASASGETNVRGRFDDHVRSREGGVIAVAPLDLDRLAPEDPLRERWDAVRARQGRRWRMYLDERTAMPTLVTTHGDELFPAGVLRGVTLDDVERRLRRFLEESGALSREDTARLHVDRHASSEVRAGHWQVVFRQAADGVLVENSRLDVHVVDGKLTMFGWSNWGPLTATGVPGLDAGAARRVLDAYLGVRTSALEKVGDPALVLIAVDAGSSAGRPRKGTGPRGHGLSHRLVWRLEFRDGETPAVWVAEIDAHSGVVRAFYDGADYAAVRGGVYPISPNVGCESGGCEMDGFPLPFADWAETGQTGSIADAYGNLTCADPGATFETRLSGPYAVVDDSCGPLLETASCAGGLTLGVKAGENCAVAQGASPGNTAAARTAYYHVNRVNQVARSYLPGIDWLNQPVTVYSNWDAVCNASYGLNGLYLYRSGTSSATCANTGEIEGIVVHEWGHGLDYNDSGGADNTSEAYGDLVAMLASRQSCFGPGLFTDGRVCAGYGDTCLTCTGFRDHDFAARQANTPATPQNFIATHCSPGAGPCGYGVHCETYPIGEAMFDLATRDLTASGLDVDTAWQLVERLWYSTRAGSGGPIYTCALPASDSCAASSWYQRMRVADDDDADLSNGTPHAAALYAAFARHNIACGSPDDLENRSTSSCPPLPRPSLLLDASGPEPALEWTTVPGADRYVVYRGDLGCHHQQVAIATIAAGVTTFVDVLPDPDLPRYYRVEAVGANAVCRSPVSNCEMSGAGPRLQRHSHSVIDTGPNANGNGRPEPGETVTIPVTLFNGGTAAAVGVTGRLRTVDPSQGRVIEPLVGYPDIAEGTAVASGDPPFRLTLFGSGASCGGAVPMELEMHAENAATRIGRFELVLGDRRRDFANNTPVSIPRLTQAPVTSTVTIGQDQTVAELDVSVSISHPNAAELAVELTSPHGTTVRLHDHTATSGGISTRYDLETQPSGPGTMNDFVGENTLGTWTLSVRDTIFGGPPGTLNGFELHVTAAGGFDCAVVPCPDPTPSASPAGLRLDKTVNPADGSVDISFSWSGAAGASGYHLLLSPAPSFDSQVDLIGRTDGATSLTLVNGAATTPDVSFFLVRAVNSCNQESP